MKRRNKISEEILGIYIIVFVCSLALLISLLISLDRNGEGPTRKENNNAAPYCYDADMKQPRKKMVNTDSNPPSCKDARIKVHVETQKQREGCRNYQALFSAG